MLQITCCCYHVVDDVKYEAVSIKLTFNFGSTSATKICTILNYVFKYFYDEIFRVYCRIPVIKVLISFFSSHPFSLALFVSLFVCLFDSLSVCLFVCLSLQVDCFSVSGLLLFSCLGKPQKTVFF